MEKGYFDKQNVLLKTEIKEVQHLNEQGELLYTEHIEIPIYEERETYVEYTEKELLGFENYELHKWFDNEYGYKEEKYRRLIALGKNDDDGQNPTNKLTSLYLDAEAKRKRIQEIEKSLQKL